MCSVPMVVSKQSFVGQTASIPTTTIYTPTEDGDFRINLYMVASDDTVNTQIQPHISWTDEFREQSPTGIPILGSSTPFASYSTVFHAIANQPIQFLANYFPNGASPSFDAFITVIKE